MSRYYSQQYSRVNDPYTTDAFSHEMNMESESYDHLPLNQQSLPSRYLNSNYPQRGIKGWWTSWSRKKKIIVGGSVAGVIVLIIVVIAVVVSETSDKFSYTPSYAQVTNATAFTSGGATHDGIKNSDSNVAAQDTYTYYSGDETHFPASSEWISFQSMWSNNLDVIHNSCEALGDGSNNTPEINAYIHSAIQNRSAVSLVDHRFILAVILQESKGCVRIGSTKSSSGVKNPGLMQSHNGHHYYSSDSQMSILAMVQDGTQGTKDGDGLVQNLNTYGNPYIAARGYNSGYIPTSGNLSEAAGATACYVSDIANRLKGWVNAKSTCPGDAS